MKIWGPFSENLWHIHAMKYLCKRFICLKTLEYVLDMWLVSNHKISMLNEEKCFKSSPQNLSPIISTSEQCSACMYKAYVAFPFLQMAQEYSTCIIYSRE